MAFMNTFTTITLLILFLASTWDLRTRTIPNIVTLGGSLVGLAWHFHCASGIRAGIVATSCALGSGIVCGLIPYWHFRKGTTGGGDVKLFFAVGVLVGPLGGVLTYFFSYILLFVLVAARIAVRILRKERGLYRGTPTPLAPFVAAGYLVTALIPLPVIA
jgi:prepilin peptidase CpaA